MIISFAYWSGRKSLWRKKSKNKNCSSRWEENSHAASFESAEAFILENTISPRQWTFYWPAKFKYRFCFDYHTSGNRLGDLFNAIGCAQAAGLHIEIDGSNWPSIPFLSSLPRIVKHHAQSASKMVAVSMVQEMCTACKYWCWEDPKAPWRHSLPIVRQVMHHAALRHIKEYNQTIINPLTDTSSAKLADYLPIIPTVAVQYRCGDNVEQDADRYGFIPFGAITDKIPTDAKYIYILSDPPERSVAKAAEFNSKCADIIKAFHQHISSRFPCAIVVAKRGGDPFLDFARFTLSNVTICSSSTFCLWPALANRNTVYLPVSLTMGGATRSSPLPLLGPNIHFLDELLISNFTKHMPVTEILQRLRTFHRNGIPVFSEFLMQSMKPPTC